MKEKYLEYLYSKIINEEDEKKEGETSEKKVEEFKKSFNFNFSLENNQMIKYLKNKNIEEMEAIKNEDLQISDFLEGKIYLYEIIGTKRTFYFINERKIYAGKFIDIPNGENDMYEIVFSEMKKVKTQELKETEKLNLGINNIKILSKIYLIIVTCPYFKRENNTIFYFSTIENSNFKTNFKDRDDMEDMLEVNINNFEDEIKNDIKNFTELVHETDIENIFKNLKNNIFGLLKNARIKNKIYENFMKSVESNLNVKLNKYTFNYKRKDKIKVCVAFSKNKTVEEIKKTIENANHKFRN